MRNVTSHYSPNLKNFQIKSSSSILMLNISISYFHWILKDRVRTTYATAGRDGNRNGWKITKPQVNPIDAHKKYYLYYQKVDCVWNAIGKCQNKVNRAPLKVKLRVASRNRVGQCCSKSDNHFPTFTYGLVVFA